jgi:hypothetical protein
MHQLTIWATITDATPHAITGLLTDPRTDHDTGAGTGSPAAGPVTSQDRFSHLDNDPMERQTIHDHGKAPRPPRKTTHDHGTTWGARRHTTHDHGKTARRVRAG